VESEYSSEEESTDEESTAKKPRAAPKSSKSAKGDGDARLNAVLGAFEKVGNGLKNALQGSSSQQKPSGSGGNKSGVCYEFQNHGRCNRPNCRYSHGDESRGAPDRGTSRRDSSFCQWCGDKYTGAKEAHHQKCSYFSKGVKRCSRCQDFEAAPPKGARSLKQCPAFVKHWADCRGAKCSVCAKQGHVSHRCPTVKCNKCHQSGHTEELHDYL
jgi:hypothetical protein